MWTDLSKPREDVELYVDRAYDAMRLDLFLRDKLPWRSRSALQRMIREDRVLVNGVPGKPGSRVRGGDLLRLLVPQPQPGDIRHAEIPLRILFEDEWIVALDKQPGILAHPVGKTLYNTLINALHHRYRRVDDPANDVVPHLAHRLDRDTSGVLLVTKDVRIFRAIAEQFETKQVRKEYLAIVHGAPERDEGTIDLPLGRSGLDGRERLKTLVRADGAPSRTDYRVEERFAGFSLVRALPQTGRTHQIRVHLMAIGHAILCDALYGTEREWRVRDGAPPILARQALHAERLQFVHPVTGTPMEIRAPLPEDLSRMVATLRST
ncbi:MAG: RluA family pseudouridine synthase [Planctomycetes bacterium]|nr:RluA family pseudouridine synthase [Planctomycetota bacterium]MBI3845638.1 RluA family pseudouridine synthase [Planctomycetota bacterium]